MIDSCRVRVGVTGPVGAVRAGLSNEADGEGLRAWHGCFAADGAGEPLARRSRPRRRRADWWAGGAVLPGVSAARVRVLQVSPASLRPLLSYLEVVGLLPTMEARLPAGSAELLIERCGRFLVEE